MVLFPCLFFEQPEVANFSSHGGDVAERDYGNQRGADGCGNFDACVMSAEGLHQRKIVCSSNEHCRYRKHIDGNVDVDNHTHVHARHLPWRVA